MQNPTVEKAPWSCGTIYLTIPTPAGTMLSLQLKFESPVATRPIPIYFYLITFILIYIFFFQGVSLAKVIEAGDFICTALSRQTNSKVARARGKALWCVPAGRWCLNMWLPFKMLPLLLLPLDLLPPTSYLFIWALFILVQKIIRSFKAESSRRQCCPFVDCCVWSEPDHYFCVKCFEWLFLFIYFFGCVCLHTTNKGQVVH